MLQTPLLRVTQGLYIVALLSTVSCFEINNVDTRTSLLFIGENGKPLDSSGTPDCGPPKKMILKSFSYNHMVCFFGDCKSVWEEVFSEVTAFELHQNCSFKSKCDYLQFSVPTNISSGMVPAVSISYECVASTPDAVVNMCVTKTTYFRKRIYLLVDENVVQFGACECHLNHGNVSVDIKDLILTSQTDKARCTSMELLINSDHSFKCLDGIVGYGSVFDLKVIKKDNKGFIAIKSPTQTENPVIVLLALGPEDIASIECRARRPWVTTTKNSHVKVTAVRTVAQTDDIVQTSKVSTLSPTLLPEQPESTSPDSNCPALVAPADGLLSTLAISTGTTVMVSCDPNFMLDGASTLQCQTDGTWDNAIGKCRAENESSLLTNILIIAGIIGIFGIIGTGAVCVIQVRSRARNSSNYNTQPQQESGAVPQLNLKNVSQKSNVKPVAEEESVQTLEKRTDNSNEIARDGSEANAPFTQPLIPQALNEDTESEELPSPAEISALLNVSS